ncbi:hypothetical protein CAPTEDRAFT_220245 [Capitella teleta]|uniref:Class II aldolase/adducin N-terminal domain-containing protein n=1 Tax=Capitella teleta TaxID=283909 RepID=R7U356_CAPTE|nr:hypothetical protein CAPTEDRAFT_220245 [Capitella teleta]|eukprot:ELU00775.1 hypothetical protein CAPTEDRAFT_220245 [Capitella teleta]
MERSRRHKRKKQDGESKRKRQKQKEEEVKAEEQVEEVKTQVTQDKEATKKPEQTKQEPPKEDVQPQSTSEDSNQVEDQSKTLIRDEALANDESVSSTQAEPEASVQSEPSAQAEPEASVQSEPSTQAEPEASVQSEPSTQAEPEASVQSEPSTQAEPEAPVQSEPSTQAEPEAPVPSEASTKEIEEKTQTAQNEEDDSCSVVFSVHRIGNLESFFEQLPGEKKTEFEEKAALMISTVQGVIEAGGSPAKDGLVTANASFKLQISDTKYVFAVLRSGLQVDKPLNVQSDVCIITQFDPTHWAADFVSDLEDAVPTSDVPIYWMSYKAGKRFKWTKLPTAILHGHSMFSREMAQKVCFPITPEPTLASTPLDTQTVLDLYETNSYPETKIFIREGHGFLLLASSLQEASEEFEASIVPNL